MEIQSVDNQPVYLPNEQYLNFERIKNESYLHVPKQTIKFYPKALITASNHLFSKGKYIPAGIKTFFDDRQLPLLKSTYLYYKSAFNLKNKYQGQYIWAHNDQSNNYYHWLCETLPRLFVIAENKTEATIIIPQKFKLLKFITESLDLLNLNYVLYDDISANYFEDIVTIETSPAKNIVNPVLQKQLANALLNALKVNSDLVPEKKIYLSRSKAKLRKIVNEDEILPLLKSAGYSIIYAEDLSFKQQIEVFSTAASFISIHGAGQTNMMFMAPGGRVMEIRNGVWDTDPWKFNPLCYYQLANIFQIKWVYHDTQPASSSGNFNDMVIDVKSFQKDFRAFESL